MSKSHYTRQMLTLMRKQILQNGVAPPRSNKYKMVNGRLIYSPKTKEKKDANE